MIPFDGCVVPARRKEKKGIGKERQRNRSTAIDDEGVSSHEIQSWNKVSVVWFNLQFRLNKTD